MAIKEKIKKDLVEQDIQARLNSLGIELIIPDEEPKKEEKKESSKKSH